MAHKIEVYSAGGGIIIAEVDVDHAHYAVVSNEAPEFLSIYNRIGADEPFLPEDMVFSANVDELDDEKKTLHAELVAALDQ